MYPLKGIEGAVLQPQAGGRFQNRQIGRYRVQHLRRQRRGKERVVEVPGLPLQPRELFQTIGRCLPGRLKLGGVVVFPRLGPPPINLLFREGRVLQFPGVGPPGLAPGQHKAHRSRLTGPGHHMGRQHCHVPGHGLRAAPCRRVIDPGRQRAGGGELPPEGMQAVDPATALPVFLIADALGVRRHGLIAVVRGIPVRRVRKE